MENNEIIEENQDNVINGVSYKREPKKDARAFTIRERVYERREEVKTITSSKNQYKRAIVRPYRELYRDGRCATVETEEENENQKTM